MLAPMICGACGFANPETARACQRCGASISAAGGGTMMLGSNVQIPPPSSPPDKGSTAHGYVDPAPRNFPPTSAQPQVSPPSQPPAGPASQPPPSFGNAPSQPGASFTPSQPPPSLGNAPSQPGAGFGAAAS